MIKSVRIDQLTVDQTDAVEEECGVAFDHWFTSDRRARVLKAILVHGGPNDPAEVGTLPMLEIADHIELGSMDDDADPTRASGSGDGSSSREPLALRQTG